MLSFTFVSTLLLCNALPTEIHESESRSLFQDVIKSMKIRSQLSDDLGSSDENAVSQQYDDYQVDRGTSHLHFPTGIEYMPRRNDRIDLPLLRDRIPKQANIVVTTEKDQFNLKEKAQEFVILIDTHKTTESKSPTPKPKKTLVSKQPKPTTYKDKIKISNQNQITDGNDTIINEPENPEISTEVEPPMALRPQNNNMSGQSQIGNRESQMVIKPTVIVNFRGTITNRDSDIRLEGRNNEENLSSVATPPQNVFNIKQDVHIEKTYAIVDQTQSKLIDKVPKEVKIVDDISKTIISNKNQAHSKDLSSVPNIVESVLTAVTGSEFKVSDLNRKTRAYEKEEVIIVDVDVESVNGKMVPFYSIN